LAFAGGFVGVAAAATFVEIREGLGGGVEGLRAGGGGLGGLRNRRYGRDGRHGQERGDGGSGGGGGCTGVSGWRACGCRDGLRESDAVGAGGDFFEVLLGAEEGGLTLREGIAKGHEIAVAREGVGELGLHALVHREGRAKGEDRAGMSGVEGGPPGADGLLRPAGGVARDAALVLGHPDALAKEVAGLHGVGLRGLGFRVIA